MNSYEKQKDDFDMQFKQAGKLFGFWFLSVGALALGFTGVIIWAIIELVQWLVSK